MTATSSWKPRLVALDVDGTVLDPDTQTISAPVRAAVSRVAAQAQVVIATGRSMLGALPVLDELGMDSGEALCSNGAVRVDVATGEAVSVETFDPQPVHERLNLLLPGALFAAEQLGKGSLVTEPFPAGELHGPQWPSGVPELVAKPVPRLIANWAGHSPAEVWGKLEGVELPGCIYTIDHYEPWVTVVPDGVTKAASLEKLRVELGVASEDTLAVGDGDNDIQMLSWARHGVAMGQAPATVRLSADEVTGAVAEDGLVGALERWFPLD
ncbi:MULTISPECIES: HAD family hydrolase [Actinopolyspora]|uniref:Hydroxymethylpyrimidine pyrophosphatase n=1 Tax=Actinopolyspora saharensis TaxID=995062 RepID=A0A1H1G2I4_9ACTN|nr:HAD family hydrolase [Actinopolyspora saharensis]NHD16314.1 HAD family phosphatase [Actinopolyspora sp. BKK2]NHE75823.1 HAD family phosphatase [Actinopolyspora sp. BKK1]SDR07390.1 Hydroxymethylpyrimidine pyrophosphatase [Actinopolyspora saharensis]